MKQAFVAIVVALVIGVHAKRYTASLSKWTFTIQNDTKQYTANVPSTLSLDLIDNGLISKDPYYRDNFLKFYNYQTKDASYSTQFTIPDETLMSKHQYLIFEGLDTYADVYLNGERILSAENMFRRYELEVNFKANNTLVVNFTSSVKMDLKRQAQFKQNYGFSLPQNYSFTRKAAYQYGWDWGPRILTLGIWKEAKVLIYDDTKIQNLRMVHDPVTKTSTSILANVTANISHLNPENTYELAITIWKQSDNKTIVNIPIRFHSVESQNFQFPLLIKINDSNTIWWTWDLGKPNLIGVQLTLTNLNTSGVYQQKIRTGIRTIQVIQEKESNGSSFKFNLNGYDVYMRGGNYIPPEMSLARTNKSTYQQVTKDALFAKFNMIRLWGGGQFEKDEFYEAMDEAGILIWHDLMFACALYPSSESILSSIEAEMRDNVKRIRHHPSMGLWNGNNQVWIGWLEWGWQRGLTTTQKQLVQKMYNDVFQVILPKVLKEEHPDVYYWETSPSVSSGSPSSTFNTGDIHFWRVWGGGTNIEEYQYYIGRFNSEYGMQAMPEMSSIQKFTAPEDRFINSYVLRLHERHPFGDKYLPGYTFNYSGTTSNLTRFAYFSQVMQAYALQMAIVSLRLNKPYNMGSLYWQLNDVWPVSSWATVDYYGTYKAAHYRIRQVYQELMIHTLHDVKSGDYIVYIVNEHNQFYYCHCTLTVELYTGQIHQKEVYERTVPPFSRVMVRRFAQEDYANLSKLGFIKTQLITTSNNVSTNNYFFVSMKERPNLVPTLKYTISGQQITISTNRLASYVWIYRKVNNQLVALKVSDNYFTLTADQSKVVFLQQLIPKEQIFVTCYQIEKAQENPQEKHQVLTQEQ